MIASKLKEVSVISFLQGKLFDFNKMISLQIERCEAEIKRLERLIRDHSSRQSILSSEETLNTPALTVPTVTWTGWSNCLLSY